MKLKIAVFIILWIYFLLMFKINRTRKIIEKHLWEKVGIIIKIKQ